MRSRHSPPSPWNSATGRPSPKGISPASLAVCALATLVALPVILASRASGESDVLVAAAAPTTSETAVAVSEIEVDVSRLFDAGADESEMSSNGLATPAGSADLVAKPVSNTAEAPNSPSRRGTSATLESERTAETETTETTETTAAPATSPPTSAAPTTAPPQTAAPTTAALTTAAPATTVPVTEAPVTEAPVAEEPAADAAPVETASGEPTAEQWANLRQCESGGNYQIVSSNGLYYGAYQFNPATWNGVARSAARSALVGILPSAASPSDQDAMALALWRQSGASPWPHCGKYLK